MDELLTKKIDFPEITERPYFYASYVQTIDGKIFVNKPGYWPIGSRNDYQYFTLLRAHADVILEGKNTALRFGKHTLDTINKAAFKDLRKKLGRREESSYMIVTTRPDLELVSVLQNDYSYRPTIITDNALDPSFANIADEVILPKSNEGISIPKIADFLFSKNYRYVFLDTGPTMFQSFLTEGFVDELFITIAPKFFGNENGNAITLGERGLYASDAIPQWNLVSSHAIGNEIFLRYRRKR